MGVLLQAQRGTELVGQRQLRRQRWKGDGGAERWKGDGADARVNRGSSGECVFLCVREDEEHQRMIHEILAVQFE